MLDITRREFVTGLAAAGTATWLASRQTAFAQPAPKKIVRGSDLVDLGKTGLKLSLLGIGTGTVGGSQQRAMGQEGFTKLVRHALDRGLTYLDTADMYMMHVLFQFALKGVPRDKYFINTKTMAKHPEVAKADINRFCRELGVKYLDCVLMHCMTTATWPTDMRPVLDVLLAEKKKGRIRSVGISCHGWDPLAASVDAPDIDVQLARINPFNQKMDAEPEKVAPLLKQMHDKGRGILGMKIFGETGFESKEKRLESLKYVLGLKSVDAFTIGFTNTDQLDETMELIELAQK